MSTVRHQHPSRFVETLQTNSADLLKISEDFLPLAHKYALISYYEEHIDRVLNAVVWFSSVYTCYRMLVHSC